MIEKCLYCQKDARFRVGIDVVLKEGGDIKVGYIFCCDKHIKYTDIIHNVNIQTCFESCLRELR